MKLEIYFSEKEMEDFLVGCNYTIETVDTWRSENVYHGKVEYIDSKVKIAYQNKPSDEELERDFHYLSSTYSVEAVFTNELKQTLLKLK